ncbi:MAG: hypothetical protein NTU43_08785 [Bacteroidetes bacterium]|nr:hypothetical protein [Bacteroidota bacterium]
MKHLKLFFIAFLITSSVFAQDILVLRNGNEIKSKVLEITPTEIKYNKYDSKSSVLITILKSEVFMIKYEDGTKDLFSETKKVEQKKIEEPNSEDLFQKGQDDSYQYYSNAGPGTGTLFTTLFAGGIVGLIPAIICSSTTPSDNNLNYPNYELIKNIDYKKGYTMQSKKIKSRKVWANWGAGVAVNILSYLVYINVVHK